MHRSTQGRRPLVTIAQWSLKLHAARKYSNNAFLQGWRSFSCSSLNLKPVSAMRCFAFKPHFSKRCVVGKSVSSQSKKITVSSARANACVCARWKQSSSSQVHTGEFSSEGGTVVPLSLLRASAKCVSESLKVLSTFHSHGEADSAHRGDVQGEYAPLRAGVGTLTCAGLSWLCRAFRGGSSFASTSASASSATGSLGTGWLDICPLRRPVHADFPIPESTLMAPPSLLTATSECCRT
mmetsp:Transcript_30675/g.55649  ORF Transcript_30675/g.55649 Transcript_30675/m.55649 type:complete len:238 (-) Transcript_30675:98-811(-)